MSIYAYLPGSDLLSSMINSSGFFWSRTYEQQRNLIASVENRFDENMISAFAYANDSLARRTRRVDNDAVTNDFGYNVRSEVIGAAMGTNRYRYAYDPIGNRLTATNNAEGWTYLANPLNQYTNIADGVIVTPAYDADGNMTATGDGWRYVWNGENRMILASNATTLVTYAYDHQGRMVTKQFSRRGAGAQSWEVERTASLLWDGYNIVHQTITNPQSTITNAFVWGLDLSGSLQGAGGVGGLLAEVKDGEPYFAAFDANGNVTEYIGTNGVTEAHYEYSPFGELVVQSGELADSFTHRFSTKPWCPVTGLSEYEFRKYEPGMGRWLSRDPIEEGGGNNLYVWSQNDSLGHLDILGMEAAVCCDETTMSRGRKALIDTYTQVRSIMRNRGIPHHDRWRFYYGVGFRNYWPCNLVNAYVYEKMRDDILECWTCDLEHRAKIRIGPVFGVGPLYNYDHTAVVCKGTDKNVSVEEMLFDYWGDRPAGEDPDVWFRRTYRNEVGF